ncbi:MAG TPA: DUF1385 domain-containing protein [Candidatus Onthenecus intestinigallinarum]|uniref:DUF1385 domain-containing protein n=1 Tax=Candidatus Onthenecus intestinigallinarum TaxID=2840875 RepID=A0A9D0Z8Y3_9FIRM|nr:DUF1385 domain-containing protein [Candidatus Onthenecus intestinigallinarum]
MNKPRERFVDIGGQAVMEGVMMKSPDAVAVAVRRPDGSIVVDREPYVPLSRRHRWMGWPIVRGVVNMVSMLAMGMGVLQKSTQMLGVLEEEPSRFEKWLANKLGANIDKIVMGVAGVLAVCLSVLLFVMLPSGVATLAGRSIDNAIVINLIGGVVRIAILIAYIGLIGLMPDMRRIYQYHGAEHKTVYCHEAGLPLTPDNARRFSRLHPRCGTSFLLLVMVISILVGSVADQVIIALTSIEKLSFGLRFVRSLLILPLIAGISYEVLKGLAHSENRCVRALRWPGLMMQHLTTREPDDQMLEVAIASMKAALGTVEDAAPAKQWKPDEAAGTVQAAAE